MNFLEEFIKKESSAGITMSLFVDSLAFKDDALYEYADRLAILGASFLSGVVGYLILRCGKGCEVETKYE